MTRQTAFELTPNAQIFPRTVSTAKHSFFKLQTRAKYGSMKLNTALGGSADDIFLIVSDLGTDSGSSMDFIDG